MKKIVFCTVGLMILLLTACGTEMNSDAKMQEQSISVEDKAKCIPDHVNDIDCIIANMDSVWPESDIPLTYAISIMDMDANGRLEVIVAENDNSGSYTSSHIYEVNDSHSGLVPISFKYISDHDEIEEPDIITENVRVYESNGNLFYIYDDYTREGNDYHKCKRLSTCKKGNVIEIENLTSLEAKYEIIDDGMGYVISVYDSKGESTNLEYYRNADKDVYEMATIKHAIFNWEYVSKKEDISTELLSNLYNSFAVLEGDLLENPYYDPDNMEEMYVVVE